MRFTWEAVEDVLRVAVLQALDLVTIKFDGLEDLGSGASVVDFAGLHC